jgi:hypothetical protein
MVTNIIRLRPAATSESAVATFPGMLMLSDRRVTMSWVGFGALVTSILTSLDSETSVARSRLKELGGKVYWGIRVEAAFCLPYGIQLAQGKQVETWGLINCLVSLFR